MNISEMKTPVSSSLSRNRLCGCIRPQPSHPSLHRDAPTARTGQFSRGLSTSVLAEGYHTALAMQSTTLCSSSSPSLPLNIYKIPGLCLPGAALGSADTRSSKIPLKNQSQKYRGCEPPPVFIREGAGLLLLPLNPKQIDLSQPGVGRRG